MNPFTSAVTAKLYHNATVEQVKLLEDNPKQWRAALEVLMSEVTRELEEADSQLSFLPADISSDDLRNFSAEKRRRRARHELHRIQKSLADVDRFLYLRETDNGDNKIYSLLVNAIERHRSMNNSVWSEHDKSLYDALKGFWTFDKINKEVDYA